MLRKNTEPYIATYLHAKGARLGLPIGANFELTARCNFHCPMCYVHLTEEQVRERGRELTAEEWIEIARQAKDKGAVFALLTGGEPFVRKDFFQIYKAMKAMGLIISINSNGSMIEGKIREQLLEDPPFRINISLYGGSNETYQKMCGQPVFDKVVNNIKALKAAGVQVAINLSITPQNCHDIEKIYNVSRELDVPIRGSSYMYPSIRVNGEQYGCGNRLTVEEAAKYGVEWDLLRFSEEEFNGRAISMKNMSLCREKECTTEPGAGVTCRAGSSAFWMTWDGKMYPCGMMVWPIAYPLEEGFERAWENIKRETKLIKGPSECASCAKKEMCYVCAAVCVTETGSFEKVPKYVCRHIDETIEQTWKAYQERNGNDDIKEGID